MKTKPTFGYGILAVMITLAFVALSMTGCEQPTDTPTVTLSGITAAYSGTAAVYPSTPLDTLKAGLTVTAKYSDNSSTTLAPADYALSGTLAAPASAVTVTYQGKTTTFTVTVADPNVTPAITLDRITATYTPATTIFPDTTLETLKGGLAVTAHYSDETTQTVDAAGYTLGGTLTEGPSVITVTYQGKTTTFTVTVAAAHPHNWSKIGEAAPPTCTEPGKDTWRCAADPANPHDEIRDGAAINPNAHNYNWVETKAPTCSAKGEDTGTCTYNNAHKDTREGAAIVATAHDWKNDWQTTAPTCTTAGTDTDTCKLDATHTRTRAGAAIDPDAHDWNDVKEVTAAATATVNGIKAIKCKHNGSHTKEPEFSGEYATGTAGLAFTLISGNTAYRVSRGTATGAIHIPAYRLYNGNYLPVTEIGNGTDVYTDNAFGGTNTTDNTTVTGLTFAEGSQLKTISNHAFYRCTRLTSITIPDSVTTIGDSAFEMCTRLTSVTIGSGVTTISQSAFQSCTSLASVTLPATLTTIGMSAFGSCTALTSITIPDSVTIIGRTAFYKSGLASVIIPAGVTTIGEGAFGDYTSLASVTFEGTIASSGFNANAFYNLGDLRAKYLASGIGTYTTTAPVSSSSVWVKQGGNGDNDTQGLVFAAIGFPAPAYSVKDGTAASGAVVIPATYNGLPVTSIEASAFQDCTGLTGVTIPDSVMSIGQQAFQSCTSLASVTIGSGVTFLQRNVFINCTALTSVTIPASVTAIGDFAFNLTGLTSVTFAGTIADSIDSFSSASPFPGDLRYKYLAAGGGVGTYTRPNTTSTTWTKQ